jgi:hypothetical protein
MLTFPDIPHNCYQEDAKEQESIQFITKFVEGLGTAERAKDQWQVAATLGVESADGEVADPGAATSA